MTITKKIEELKSIQLEEPNKILSMYLNTDRSSMNQQNGEWKIKLKNGLKKLEEYIEAGGTKEALKNFKKIKEMVNSEILEHERDLQRSVVLFASADQQVWSVDFLQLPVETNFYWEEYPVVDQLEELKENYPSSGIVVVNQEEVRVVEAELGQVKESIHYTLDLETEDWRQHEGPHHADVTLGKGGKSYQQEQYKDRFEANKQRWYKSLAPKIDKKAKDHHWEQIVVIGEKEEALQLKEQMNKEIEKLIAKNLGNRADHEIVSEVFQ
jgi:hypothetical protein